MNIRYGILGAARIAERFVQGVQSSKLGEVHALASRDGHKAAEWAKAWGIPKSYGSYEALLADPEVDAVYVPTINHLHHRHALAALRAGKHVLLEKPFTLTLKEARELFDVAQKEGLLLMEAQKALFLPVTRRVRSIIQSGRLGRIHYLEYVMSFPHVYHGWFYEREKGGGALLGSGSYLLHHSTYLLDQGIGDFRVSGLMDSRGVDLQTQLQLSFPQGAQLSGIITTLVKAKSRAVIYGEGGRVEIPDFWKAREAFVHMDDGEEETLSEPCDHEMVYEVDHFNDCILKGRKESPLMDRERTLMGVAFLEEMRSSMEVRPHR